MTRTRANLLGLVLILISVGIAVWAYPRLPAVVATHWDLAGHPNGYATRFWSVAIWPLLCTCTWLLMLVLPTISPKGFRIDRFIGAFDVAMLTIIAVFVVENYFALRAGMHSEALPTTVFLSVLGVLLVVLGNLMGKFRKNFFIGVRTPWTLASDEVWLRTHRLAGQLFMLAGIGVIVCSFFPIGAIAILPIVLAASIIPVVYSYVLYHRIEGFGPDES